MKSKIVLFVLAVLTAASLFIAGCDSGDYKTGGGGKPQHYNTGNGQYD